MRPAPATRDAGPFTGVGAPGAHICRAPAAAGCWWCAGAAVRRSRCAAIVRTAHRVAVLPDPRAERRVALRQAATHIYRDRTAAGLRWCASAAARGSRRAAIVRTAHRPAVLRQPRAERGVGLGRACAAATDVGHAPTAAGLRWCASAAVRRSGRAAVVRISHRPAVLRQPRAERGVGLRGAAAGIGRPSAAANLRRGTCTAVCRPGLRAVVYRGDRATLRAKPSAERRVALPRTAADVDDPSAAAGLWSCTHAAVRRSRHAAVVRRAHGAAVLPESCAKCRVGLRGAEPTNVRRAGATTGLWDGTDTAGSVSRVAAVVRSVELPAIFPEPRAERRVGLSRTARRACPAVGDPRATAHVGSGG